MKGIKEKNVLSKTALIVAIAFAISLLPIIYVGLHNYTSGDDFWYGAHTYQGWLKDGLIGALKGSLQTVAEFYESWQGTWFTMFLFTLSPNHFWKDGYVIVVFISLGCLIGSISYLADYYLVKKLNFTKGAATIVVCMVSYLALQYIPRTTSGIYWFNGVMHYSIPLLLGIFAVIHSHKFIDSKKRKDYIILFICFTLLGGGSYLAPLAATLAVLLLLICRLEVTEFNWKNKKINIKYDRKNLWILLAIAAELIGLIISFKAPGNRVREEQFGGGLKWALQCVYYAIDRGIYLGEDYFLKNAVTTVVYIILAVLIWNQLWRVKKEKIKFRFPLLFVIYMNGIYWSTYTPEIYSRSSVSGGVPNTYFHIFLMITLANMVYVHGWLQEKLIMYWKKKAVSQGDSFENIRDNSILYYKKYEKCAQIPMIILGCIGFILVSALSENITTNEYCMKCITDGSLKKYVEVREKQDELLIGTQERVVTVPEIEAPYPLLHMIMNGSGNGSQNIDRALYYDKDIIYAEMIE